MKFWAIMTSHMVLGVWIGFDVHKHTQLPGQRILWACFGGILVFVMMSYIWRRQIKALHTHDDGKTIADARGDRRTVAHTKSAGLLTTDLPPNVQRDVRAAAASKLFSQRITLPSWQSLLPIAIAFVLLGALYWRAYPLLQVYFPVTFSALVGVMYSEMPTQMARAYLAHGYCPSCTYRLLEVPPQSDGCVVCPECGAAWNVPNQPDC